MCPDEGDLIVNVETQIAPVDLRVRLTNPAVTLNGFNVFVKDYVCTIS